MHSVETYPELNPESPRREFVPRGQDDERDRLADHVYQSVESLHRQSGEDAFAVLFDGESGRRPHLRIAELQSGAGYEMTYFSYNHGEEGLRPLLKWVAVSTEAGHVFDRGTMTEELQLVGGLLWDGNPKLVDLAVLEERTVSPVASVVELEKMFDQPLD